jgi:histidine triad (HIT) family protein
MSDFYCEQVLSGKTQVEIVEETDNVLAFFHTRPFYEHHVVIIPKRHIPSLISLTDSDNDLLSELLAVVRHVAESTTAKFGACRVITNIGEYQDSKHLHFHVVYGNKVR